MPRISEDDAGAEVCQGSEQWEAGMLVRSWVELDCDTARRVVCQTFAFFVFSGELSTTTSPSRTRPVLLVDGAKQNIPSP